MATLDEEDLRNLAKMLAAELKVEKHRWWVEPETHAEQHQFLSEWLAERRRRQAFWDKIKQSVVGWLIIVVLGGFITLVGTAVYDWFVRAVHIVVNKGV